MLSVKPMIIELDKKETAEVIMKYLRANTNMVDGMIVENVQVTSYGKTTITLAREETDKVTEEVLDN